jgi:hypothetical protein
MKKVFKIISSYSDKDTLNGLKRLNEEETNDFYSFENEPDATFLKFDGTVCHWEKGHLMLAIIIGQEKVELFKYLDDKIHEGCEGYTTIEDITEEILYTIHDTSIYGFIEGNMQHDFHTYRQSFLSKDDVLDKICKHGIESLNENDKLFLQDKELKHPIYLK